MQLKQMTKTLLLTLSILIVSVATPMAASKAQRTHDRTIKNIINDVHDDIRRAASYGRFGITTILDLTNDDMLNKVVMTFVREGYTVSFDILPPDYNTMRLSIDWEKPR